MWHPKTRSGLVLSMVTGFVTAGCGDAGKAGAGPECGGGKCDAVALEPMAAPLWVSCWVAAKPAGGAELACRQEANAIWAPSSVSIQATGAGNAHLGLVQLVSGQTTTVADVSSVTWPVQLRAYANPNFEAIVPAGAFPTSVEATLAIADPTAATPAAPATLAAPFGLWPIELAVSGSSFVIFNSDDQAVGLTPWMAGDTSSYDLDWGIYTAEGAATRYYLAIAPSGAWQGKVEVDGGTYRGTISGPGRYVATADGLRLATDADAALFANLSGTPVVTDPVVTDPVVTDPVEPVQPACADAAYLSWISDYGTAVDAAGNWLSSDEVASLDAKLAGKPCTPASAAAYEAWLAFFAGRLQAFYPVNGTLDQDERAVLARLAAVAPVSTDDGAYVAWHGLWQTLVAQALPTATSSIDADERAVLDLVATVRPDADGDAAFNAWLELFTARLAAYLPTATASLDADERANLELLAAVRPGTATELAYVAWLATYRTYFEQALPTATASLDSDEQANLAAIAAVRPAASGDAAWSAWFEIFTARLGQFGSSVDSDEQAILTALAAIKPCGNAASAATFAAATGDAGALSVANPAQCE